jgi:hypothetical protein
MLFERIGAIMAHQRLAGYYTFRKVSDVRMTKGRKWSREEVRTLLDYKRWGQVRAAHLRKQPYCVNCEKRGIKTVATDVDHIVPKRDTPISMWYEPSNLQSYCKHCHDTSKFEEETLGYATDIGLDGFPIDRRHPVYKEKKVISIEDYLKIKDKAS